MIEHLDGRQPPRTGSLCTADVSPPSRRKTETLRQQRIAPFRKPTGYRQTSRGNMSNTEHVKHGTIKSDWLWRWTLAASRASTSAAAWRDSRHRLEASVDERDRRRPLCVRSRRQDSAPRLRRGRQPSRRSSRSRRGAGGGRRISGRVMPLTRGIARPAIQFKRVSGVAAPRPRRSECHPRRIAGVAARQGLLLRTDSNYVGPASSRKRARRRPA
jgi:hypothetical protein